MKKTEFRQALRDKLRKVPLTARQKWNDTDLLVWWQLAKSEDSYLTWDGCCGDLWQSVPGMCQDLVGKNAF